MFRMLARALVAAMLVEACCGAAASAPTTIGGALGFQINTAHTGYVQTAGVKPPLKVRWKVGFPAAVSYPIVTNGAVSVVGGSSDRRMPVQSSEAKTSLRVDRRSRASIWMPAQIPTGAAILSDASVATRSRANEVASGGPATTGPASIAVRL